ncbi:uncharacterized protein A4U43_C04F6070 [Asparagus officinalis]|uniref:Amino acid transporter transmembrane domain-containing protein n=1 Tax=Asparagus officinalis TaxID=4686 RepID=A0A5P1EYN8_ASPOF|nr:uncharacterized protein A4U43_C04F6070 [Asparagus officinalis]
MEDNLKDADARSTKIDALGVESGQQVAEYVNVSAHAVDKDSWQQVGLLMVTGFNCAYVLSFSNLMLVPLGWAWGLTVLVVMAAFAFYANWLLAEFHIIDDHRFIRYRDIMDYVFGRRLYYTTWILQFVTLLLVNMGFVLLGGRALKEINSEFSSSPVRLQMFLTITGFAYFIFANLVPSMSAMRNWLATSAILTIIYDVILFVILVKDGCANKNKDYNISGSKVDKFFNMFIAPIHEALDTRFLRLEEDVFSRENLIRRFLLRALVFGMNTFITALLPFIGDFVNIFGSFTLFPLTFVFPSMVFIKVKRKFSRRGETAWHWANIVIFSLLSVITTAAAGKLLINNAQKYKFFADT